jgi:hypothetical protein
MILELDGTAVIAIARADVDQRFMRGSSPNEALVTLSHQPHAGVRLVDPRPSIDRQLMTLWRVKKQNQEWQF